MVKETLIIAIILSTNFWTYLLIIFVTRKYGYSKDKPEYAGKRIAQVFFYGRNFENDNFYGDPFIT